MIVLQPLSAGPWSCRRPYCLTLILALLGALGLWSCIERSNPFDPLNLGPKVAEDIRKGYEPALDSLLLPEILIADRLNAYLSLFTEVSDQNAFRTVNNADLEVQNRSIAVSNLDLRQSNNIQVNIDSLRFLGSFALIDTLLSYGPYAGFREIRDDLRLQSLAVANFMAMVNASKIPQVVYTPAYMDSVLGIFRRDSLGFVSFQVRIDSANSEVKTANIPFKAYLELLLADNREIGFYNDSIEFLKQNQNKNFITSTDSLINRAAAALPGDTLFVGAGTYPVDMRFNTSGTALNPILVRGSPGQKTIFKPYVDPGSGVPSGSTLIISNRTYIVFESIVFRQGLISGVKLEGGSRNIVFRNCVFDSSVKWGMEIINSDAEIINCQFLHNGSGLRIQGDALDGSHVRLINDLIAKNTLHGIEALTPMGEISNCTISDNGDAGINVTEPRLPLTISNSIVSGNLGVGILREPNGANQSTFVVKESDVWGNGPISGSRNWDLTGMDSTYAGKLVSDNSNYDPKFVDPENLNYSPERNSELDNLERLSSPPIIIGYRP